MWGHILPCLRATLDLLLPQVCLLCGKHLTEPGRLQLCDSCMAGIEPLPPGHCLCCAHSFISPTSNHLCGRCLQSPPHFSKVEASGRYQGTIKDLVHALKYRHNVNLARPLGLLLYNQLCAQPADHPCADLVIPVPLHLQRLKQRSFNQAAEISRTLAKELRVPANSSVLVRHRQTASQQGLSASERKLNLRNAFSVKEPLDGLRILLVDDVMTTGETARACSRALLQAGASEVRVAVVGRA